MNDYYDITTTNIEQDELVEKSKKQGALEELELIHIEYNLKREVWVGFTKYLNKRKEELEGGRNNK